MKIKEKTNLKGIHNINNIMFVLGVSIILKLNMNETIKSIKKFKPLEHRMEYVGNIDNVDYYNDSIATIPEATINAINSIENINTIIIGGKDRGVNLKEAVMMAKKITKKNTVCLLSPAASSYGYFKNFEERGNLFKQYVREN